MKPPWKGERDFLEWMEDVRICMSAKSCVVQHCGSLPVVVGVGILE